MKTRLVTILGVAVGVLMLSGPMFAHHSQSIYDMENVISVKGTVTEFEWSNPHIVIHMNAKNDKGGTENWQIITQSPNGLHRIGWDRNTMKPGDQITVSGNRHKGGYPLMYLRKIVLPNGEVVDMRGKD